MNLLENLKNTGAATDEKDKKNTKKIDSEPLNNITYELYYAPEHAKLNQLSQISDIEKRIDYLESLLGNNPDKMVMFS